MKKRSLSLWLFIAAVAALHAQNTYIVPNATSGVIYQDPSTQYIGIGSATPASVLTLATSLSGAASVLEVSNTQTIYSGTPYPSLLVHRSYQTLIGAGPGATTHTATDMIVSESGLTGIGVAAPTAHLDITDQNADGLPLLQVTPAGATAPSLYIDPAGHAGLGLVSSVPNGLISALTLAAENLTSIPSNGALLHIANTVQSSSALGRYPYSFGISRVADGSINASADPVAVDLIVDNQGLIGMGAPASFFNFIGTHLGVTDPDNSGTIPLFSVATNTNNPTGYHLPALTVDYTGYVSIGTISQPAHLYITDLNTSGTDPLLNVVTNQSTQSLFIKSDGKVGIGNNTPSQALQVTGTTVTTKLQITDAPIDGFILKSDGSGNATWSDPGTLSSSLWAASGTEIYNTNTGNVRVNDKDIMLHGSSDINHGLGWYGTSKLWNGATIDGPVLYGYSGGALGTTNGGQKAVLHWTSDGKVQIGDVSTPNIYNASTNTGGYSLYVEGGVLAEKYKCALHTTSDWSDYVFDKGYQLKPLSDVEGYIKTNKHLPDVPSAEDVVCDGIDMANMDAILLRKIEELTLYVLDLKKDNEAMKTQLNNITK